jgi:hypothetical protein
VEEYKYFGILTVEQLAAAGDNVGQKFMGFQQDKSRAQAFLDAANGTDARVKDLEEQVKKLLAAQMEADNAKQSVVPAKR